MSRRSLVLAVLLVLASCKKHVSDDIPQVVPPPAAAATLSRPYFAFDASPLSADAKQALDEDARLLAQNPQVQVEIQGHCDERGSAAYNMALGQRRAQAVRSYLVAQRVSANRLTTVSFGEERPARSGSDEGAWSQNRRAELRLLSEAPGLDGTVR